MSEPRDPGSSRSDTESIPEADSSLNEEPQLSKPRIENPFPLIWVGWWVTVITVSDQAMISPLLPNLLNYFGVDIQYGGQITGAYFLGAASMTLIAGVLADRVGCRNVLVAAISLVAVGEIGAALAKSFGLFLAARTLVGAGSAAASLALTTYIGLHIPYKGRGKIMGLIGTGFFLGNTFGPFLVTQFVARLSLQSLFIGLAILAAIGSLHSVYTLRGDPPHDRIAGSWRDYRSVLKNRGFWGLVIVQSLFTFGVMGMIQFFGEWLESVHGMDTKERGVVFLIGGLPILLGSPIGGWLCDKIGKKPFFVAVTFLLGSVTCVLPYIEQNVVGVIVLFGAVGFVAAGRYSAYHALTTRLIEEELLGHLLALRNFINYLVAASGVTLMGFVYSSSETTGYIRMGWVTTAMLMVSIPFLIKMVPGEPVEEEG
ncbi:MAG: MFS transporter [Candidatus Omnitrophica bacterium]|nr:MFS transporter [Candidatus Omnitrophota bacterium]